MLKKREEMKVLLCMVLTKKVMINHGIGEYFISSQICMSVPMISYVNGR
jgi:hypothetical protein